MNYGHLRKQVLPLLSGILFAALSTTQVSAHNPELLKVQPQAGDNGGSNSSRSTRTIRGSATYYNDGPGFYAAVPSYRWGDPTYQVLVSYQGKSVVVTVRDHCGCYVGSADERVIDLSPAAFEALAPLSRGKITVMFTTHKQVSTIKLPETDTYDRVEVARIYRRIATRFLRF